MNPNSTVAAAAAAGATMASGAFWMGSNPYDATVNHENGGSASNFGLDSLRNAIASTKSSRTLYKTKRSGVSPLPTADGVQTSADGAVTATFSGERLDEDADAGADGGWTAASDGVNKGANNRSAQYGNESRQGVRKISSRRVGVTRQVAEILKPRAVTGKLIPRGGRDAQAGLQFLVCVPS